MHLLYIVWDPVKYLDLGFFKLHFYSVMWIVAFILGFYIMKRIYKNEGQSEESLDSLFICDMFFKLLFRAPFQAVKLFFRAEIGLLNTLGRWKTNQMLRL